MIIRIKSLRRRGGTRLLGEYVEKNGRSKYLIGDGTRAVSALSQNDKVFMRQVNANDSVAIDLTGISPNEQKNVVEFFKNHPLVQTLGYTNPNANPGIQYFELIIPDERTNHEYSVIEKRLAAASLIFTMDDEELSDTAYALGGDARGKNRKELVNYLIGQNLNGLGVSDPDPLFRFHQTKGAQKESILYATKAYRSGIITKEGSVYKCNGIVLGTSMQNVADHLITDRELFANYIKPKVDEFDKDNRAVFIKEQIESAVPADILDKIPAVVSKKGK